MSKITHTMGMNTNCIPEQDDCIWDAHNKEFVTREYYDKLCKLREKHKDYYNKSYKQELQCIKTVAETSRKYARKLLSDMPANVVKKDYMGDK